MSIPDDQALQAVATSEPVQNLAPGQRRFNTLVRQIEQARQCLADWQEKRAVLDHLCTMTVLPLQNQVFELQRKWVFGLDRIAHWADWTDQEIDTLRHLLCQASMELLLRNAQDQAMLTLFHRYSDYDFVSERAKMVQRVEGMLPQAAGGKPAPREEEAEPDDGKKGARRLSQKQLAARISAQIRRESEALQLNHAARDLFRKLASDLHPDREPNPALRALKTDLMQRANQAWADNNVFALLQLQTQADTHGLTQAADFRPERIKYFNKLLAGQLLELKNQIELIQSGMLGKLGLPLQTRCNPNQPESLIKQAVRRWRQRREHLQDCLQRITNQAHTKRWLQQTRQAHAQQVVQLIVQRSMA